MSAPVASRPSAVRRGWAVILSAVLIAVAAVDTAEAQSAGDGPVFGGIMEALGLKSRQPPAPGFVERSRPAADALHYVPVGPPRSEGPTVRTMTPAEIAATTEALDQARTRQQRGAGLQPVPVPPKATGAKVLRKANR